MRFLIIIFLYFFLSGCDQTSSYDNSNYEIDRVWQYLKKYSIYIDRIPQRVDAQKYNSPEQLSLNIMDTIRYPGTDTVLHFTYYDEYWENVKDGHVPGTYAPRLGRAQKVDAVYSKKLTDNILYVNIPRFTERCYYEMRNKSNEASVYDNIILDLRWNPGGYVSTCTSIVNLLLPKETLYLKTLHREGDTVTLTGEISLDTSSWVVKNFENDSWQNKRIAILMNEYSASASEILIEALKSDSVDSRMFGGKTFGKGIGQIHFYFNVTSGGGLSVTTLKFLRVDNSTYHSIGIEPDEIVEEDITYLRPVKAAAEYLDPTFDELMHNAELNDIKNAILDRHYLSRENLSRSGLDGFRPLAIVNEVFVSE